jgi:hypothetical protein
VKQALLDRLLTSDDAAFASIPKHMLERYQVADNIQILLMDYLSLWVYSMLMSTKAHLSFTTFHL